MDRITQLVMASMDADPNPRRIITEGEAASMLHTLYLHGEKIPKDVTPEKFADVWYEIAYHLSK